MEIIDYIISSNLKKENKKKQIVLTHSSRPIVEYTNSLKFRFNGNPNKLPHYLVSRDGKVIKIMDDDINGNFTNNDAINYKSIIICLENLGWLEKVSLKDYYINWIGNIYKQKVFDKKWRDYFFWEPYPEIQIKQTAELCQFLIEKHKIKNKCVGHNTKIEGIEKFRGIFSKSNIHEDFTDLSPAFDFKLFENYLNDESIR